MNSCNVYKIKIIHIGVNAVLSARYMPFIVIQIFMLPPVPENGFIDR